jgi:hypothetical protein
MGDSIIIARMYERVVSGKCKRFRGGARFTIKLPSQDFLRE